MNMNRKAKKFATMLKLMTFAGVLTSCGNNENEVVKESEAKYSFEIDDSEISVFGMSSVEDGIVIVQDNDKKVKITDEILEEIKNRVEEIPYHSLQLYLDKTPIDFSDIDISKFTSLTVDCPNIDFNYNPFYNRNYEFVRIVISEKTNKEDVINFLQNISDPYLNLEFTEDVSTDLINEYLEVVSKIEGLETFSIDTSANINDLTLDKIKSNRLDILHRTDKDIDYNFVVNECVTRLYLSSSYPENFTENSSMKNLNIISNSKELDINYQIFRYANTDGFYVDVDNDTIISLPDNAVLSVGGLDINNVSDSWFNQFANLLQCSFGNSFSYNRKEETISEAVEEMHFDIEGDIVDEILEEHGVSVRMYDETMTFSKYLFTNDDTLKESVTEQRVYDYINALIEKYNINRIEVEDLEKQIDFSKINLESIITTDLSDVGYNFDYAPFIADNATKSPSNSLSITIKKDNNHDNRINYIKSIPLVDDAFVSISFSDGVNTELAETYLNALDYSKISQLSIVYDKIKDLDLTTLNVSGLGLFDDSYEMLPSYNLKLNENVKDFVLSINYDEEAEEVPTVGSILINSSNSDLFTEIVLRKNSDYDGLYNGQVDINSTIKVPENSYLNIYGIEETSLTTDFLTQFENINGFYISDNANTYHYRMVIEDSKRNWYYDGEEKEEAKEKGKELLKTQ